MSLKRWSEAAARQAADPGLRQSLSFVPLWKTA